MQQAMPRLVLQPLVENAVLHGISRMPEGGTVSIELRHEAGVLHIVIRNPAPLPDAALAGHRAGRGAMPSAVSPTAWPIVSRGRG